MLDRTTPIQRKLRVQRVSPAVLGQVPMSLLNLGGATAGFFTPIGRGVDNLSVIGGT
jgi:hypothetical protein